ncbi:F-box domain protein [Pandoravirus inopinatum]|uniref:F-box domain protein n=1 Tax=Pandoravirus inopinatum TaxID=1605721 RepID=A0A0B5JCZ8_9VIRU|nr:F-box domain protein [Pandoravirus inopinatum]AJF97557.1 F-box domain protein [Pandoravirus inopinatum]
MDAVLFDALPDEMVCAVLQWLPPRWLWLASFVSGRWRCCAKAVGPRTLWLPGTWNTCSRDIKFFSDEATVRIGALLVDEAAAEGRTSVVLWLYRRLGIRWTAYTVRLAALGGHKHTIDCMRAQHSMPLPVDKACLLAALIGGPGIRLAQTIHDIGQPWTPMAMAVAVALGKRRAVLALHRAGCPHDDLAVMLALACNRQDLLDAMALTKDEILPATRALCFTPYCRQSHTRRRYAHIVCDAMILGTRGRALAMAILKARDARARGIQQCGHHSSRCRASVGVDTTTPGIPMWGPIMWSMFASIGPAPFVPPPHCALDKWHTRHVDSWQVPTDARQASALAPPKDNLLAWTQSLHNRVNVQQPTPLDRIARDSRGCESQARRRRSLAAIRPRTSPKERHRARNR